MSTYIKESHFFGSISSLKNQINILILNLISSFSSPQSLMIHLIRIFSPICLPENITRHYNPQWKLKIYSYTFRVFQRVGYCSSGYPHNQITLMNLSTTTSILYIPIIKNKNQHFFMISATCILSFIYFSNKGS